MNEVQINKLESDVIRIIRRHYDLNTFILMDIKLLFDKERLKLIEDKKP